jgi:hypothetical protein
MAQAATGQFSTNRLLFLLTAALPDRFRLKFEHEPACVAGLGAVHSARLHALTTTVEFSTTTLLATAALRHFGTSYYAANTAVAMAKELVLWSGWLNVRGDGALRLEHASNAGRLAEVAASLGEAVALDLATSAFGIPLAHWMRIPESGGGSMDFKAPGPSGDIAIEAKGGHGSVVAGRKKEIVEQKTKQTTAAEKYGFVLCYEMDRQPDLKRKGSYVKMVDPPGEQEPPTPIRTAILTHYFQLASSIGLAWLQTYLALELDPNAEPVRLSTAKNEAMRLYRAHHPRREEGREQYLGRYFDVGLLLAGEETQPITRGPSRYFFFGIAESVIAALLESNVEKVLEFARSQQLAFTEQRAGLFGPVLVTGIADGVLRVDFVSLDAPHNEAP